jgi:hypothetical protein
LLYNIYYDKAYQNISIFQISQDTYLSRFQRNAFSNLTRLKFLFFSKEKGIHNHCQTLNSIYRQLLL